MKKPFIACLVLVMLTFTTNIALANDNNWGLSFDKDGGLPRGNATAEYLQEYDADYVGSPDEKTIYITFDAGFENGNTPPILDVLKKHNASAAFFVVGHYVETNPELIRRMAEEGHIVGNHTFSHPDMSKIADIEKFKTELYSLEELIKDTTGKDMPRYYRPPQGKFSESNLAHAKELGYKTVFWSLAYVDWLVDKQPSQQEAFDKLIPRIHPGAVLLLHSTSKTNADILDELLSKYTEMGYTFGSLDDLYS
jgi:peptidoglycan-N-acetylmuramic acid deacetylase